MSLYTWTDGETVNATKLNQYGSYIEGLITPASTTYGTSASKDTEPTTWTSTIPTVTAGQFLWTKVVWGDNSTTTKFCAQYGTNGTNGTDGEDGEDGTDATITTVEYGQSASSGTEPTTWSTTMPSVAGGNYLWTRLTWNDGTYTKWCTRFGVDGQGSGDMLKSDYDSDSAVSTAGGIADYTKAVEFTATIPASGWSSQQYTITDTTFFQASGYTYFMTGAPSTFSDFADAQIYSSDVSGNSVTLTCGTTPTSQIIVRFVRVRC